MKTPAISPAVFIRAVLIDGRLRPRRVGIAGAAARGVVQRRRQMEGRCVGFGPRRPDANRADRVGRQGGRAGALLALAGQARVDLLQEALIDPLRFARRRIRPRDDDFQNPGRLQYWRPAAFWTVTVP